MCWDIPLSEEGSPFAPGADASRSPCGANMQLLSPPFTCAVSGGGGVEGVSAGASASSGAGACAWWVLCARHPSLCMRVWHRRAHAHAHACMRDAWQRGPGLHWASHAPACMATCTALCMDNTALHCGTAERRTGQDMLELELGLPSVHFLVVGLLRLTVRRQGGHCPSQRESGPRFNSMRWHYAFGFRI